MKWKDGNHKEVENVRIHLHEQLKTGKYDKLIIGCDSQVNRSKVTFVTAIVLDTENQGAIFVYKKEHLKRDMFKSINERLLKEVEYSLDVAQDLLDIMDEFDVKVSIHADVNPEEGFASNKVIKQVVGWITGMDFECQTKPYAFVASAVADKIAHK